VQGPAFPEAVDWDNDGDIDLIVGDGHGMIHYFERVEQTLVPREFDKNPFVSVNPPVPLTSSSPRVVDWDRNGQLDLLVADWQGNVQWHTLNSDSDSFPVNFQIGAAFNAHLAFSVVALLVANVIGLTIAV
jgi:hypothetical protein